MNWFAASNESYPMYTEEIRYYELKENTTVTELADIENKFGKWKLVRVNGKSIIHTDEENLRSIDQESDYCLWIKY